MVFYSSTSFVISSDFLLMGFRRGCRHTAPTAVVQGCYCSGWL